MSGKRSDTCGGKRIVGVLHDLHMLHRVTLTLTHDDDGDNEVGPAGVDETAVIVLKLRLELEAVPVSRVELGILVRAVVEPLLATDVRVDAVRVLHARASVPTTTPMLRNALT
ncbi:hypothetical protein FRC09_004837 [Ceratobasidium sp. 395]|nr:hypothetical protein FRC09_004837 [Ceratobasidium sp. 395]